MTWILTARRLRHAAGLAALGLALAGAPALGQPGRAGGDPGGSGPSDGPTGSLGRPEHGGPGNDGPGFAPGSGPGHVRTAPAPDHPMDGPRSHGTMEFDQDLARAAAARGMAVPLDRVLQTTADVAPGDVIGVRLLGRTPGRLTYEIRVLSGDGLIRTVLIDASRNEVMEVRRP